MLFVRSKIIIFSFVLIFITVIILAMTWEVGKGVTGLLWLNPPDASAPVGGTTSLDLQLDNIDNVFGTEIEMTFDPNVLAVVGGAVTPGTCPQPDFVVNNTADNLAGTVQYAVTQLSPTSPCNDGIVATIEFLCKQEDTGTSVTITNSIISDPDGIPIIHNTQNALIKCVEGTSPLLTFDPQNSILVVGQEKTIDVVIEDVSDLYGVEMEIAFDSSYLQVVDSDPSKAGIQIVPGTCPKPDFIVLNSVSNALGKVEYAAISLSPTSPCSGNGVVASIKFQAIAEGESDIHFINGILADPNGSSITMFSQDGYIRVSDRYLIYLPLVIK